MQRIEQEKKQKKKLMFLERDVIASYLSDLTRVQHRMKTSAIGERPYIWLLGFFPYRTKDIKV